jgi:hypothetical protein
MGGQTLSSLVVGIGLLPQGPIVDIPATAEGLGQQIPLFLGRIESILVRLLLLHVLHCSRYGVESQQVVKKERLGHESPRTLRTDIRTGERGEIGSPPGAWMRALGVSDSPQPASVPQAVERLNRLPGALAGLMVPALQ